MKGCRTCPKRFYKENKERLFSCCLTHPADEAKQPVVDPGAVGEEERRARGQRVEEEKLLLDADSPVISLLRLVLGIIQ